MRVISLTHLLTLTAALQFALALALTLTLLLIGRAFLHSAGTAPIIMLFIPGTPLKTTHLQKHARSIQNSIGGAEFRTLGPVATGGGKQPTFRTARAQGTVRPQGGLSG